MAKFKFTAITPDGATVSGSRTPSPSAWLVAPSSSATWRRSTSREKKSVLQFEITKKKVPRRELMHFSRQMAVFMRAGIPVLEALEVMTEEVGDKVFQRILAEMSEALRSGETFAGAADAHPEAFPPYYLGILRSAELTGNLDTVLDQLADYIERDIEARRKITSALIYPAIVMVLAIVAVVVITSFVLPRFKTFFSSLHAKLPLPTRMLDLDREFLRHGLVRLRRHRAPGHPGRGPRHLHSTGTRDPGCLGPARPGARRCHQNGHLRAILPDPVLDGGTPASRFPKPSR